MSARDDYPILAVLGHDPSPVTSDEVDRALDEIDRLRDRLDRVIAERNGSRADWVKAKAERDELRAALVKWMDADDGFMGNPEDRNLIALIPNGCWGIAR